MKLKKYLALILSLCMMGGAAASLAACGDDSSSGSSPASTETESESGSGDEAAEVNYIFTVTDENGEGVEGVELVLSRLGEEVASGETAEDGKLTGTVAAGEYTLTVVSSSLPAGYLADEYVMDVELTEESATVEIGVTDTTPDGTAKKPYTFIPNDEGAMEIALPASAEVNYIIYRAMGRSLVVECADVEIVYNGVTYQAEDGKIEIELGGSAEDINTGAQIAVKNLTATEKELKMQLVSELGTLENPIVIGDLSEDITLTVEGKETVYLVYTATASGRLSYTVNGTNGAISMYNENSYVMTDEETPYLDLNEGDLIHINVTVDDAKDNEAYEVIFTLALQEAQNG
ncbi:MAG: hypothetical protein IJX91_00205 [Clostridia bacterium]|nr:hypothetical protein [Clostridia bacterium]